MMTSNFERMYMGGFCYFHFTGEEAETQTIDVTCSRWPNKCKSHLSSTVCSLSHFALSIPSVGMHSLVQNSMFAPLTSRHSTFLTSISVACLSLLPTVLWWLLLSHLAGLQHACRWVPWPSWQSSQWDVGRAWTDAAHAVPPAVSLFSLLPLCIQNHGVLFLSFIGAQRGGLVCPESHSEMVAEWLWHPWGPDCPNLRFLAYIALFSLHFLKAFFSASNYKGDILLCRLQWIEVLSSLLPCNHYQH